MFILLRQGGIGLDKSGKIQSFYPCRIKDVPIKMQFQNDYTIRLKIVFDDFEFKYLGASLKNKNEGMTQASLIRAINRHIRTVNKEYGLNLQLTSHSLRIGYVTQFLTKRNIEKVRQLVGHKSIQTTLKYTKYNLNERGE